MSKKDKYRDMPVDEYKGGDNPPAIIKRARGLENFHKLDEEKPCENLIPISKEDENVATETVVSEMATASPQPDTALSNEPAADEVAKKESPNLNGYQLAKLYICKKSLILYMDNLFVYIDGKGYRLINDKALQRDMRAVLPEEIKPFLNKYTLSEAVEFIHSDFAEKITDETLDKITHLMAFSNCILNTETRETFDLSPSQPIFTVLNIPYYRGRKPMFSGAWNRFLDQITGGNEEYKTVIRQVLGYLLSSYSCAKTAIFFVGLPNTGKSTLCKLIQRIVGSENTSGVPWSKLDHKFYNGTIFSKHMNVSAEMSTVPLKSIEYFKMLTGADCVLGEEKYGNVFFYTYRGKLLFSGNNPPYTDELDSSDAFFDRLLLLPFMNQISQKDKNTNIIDELMEDADAIIFEALVGLRELRSQNWVFSRCKAVDDYKQNYMIEVDSVRYFVESTLVICDHTNKEFLRNLYEEYKNFCYRNCVSAYEMNTFRKQIGKYGKLDEKLRIGGETLTGVRGLRFRNDSDNSRLQ